MPLRLPRPLVAAMSLGLVVGVAALVPTAADAVSVPPTGTAVVTLDDGATIGTLNTSDGSTSAWVGPRHSGLYGNAFGDGGVLFGLEGGQLVSIDQTTGASTAIGSRQGFTYGLDRGPDGTMYAVSYGGPRGSGLYAIDTVTGTSTFVGTSKGAMDVTFDCAGTLWGVDAGKLSAYDLTTGAVTRSITLTGDPAPSSVMGLFTDATGRILATTYQSPGKLYAVDTTSGALTLIGSSAGSRPHGGDDAHACAGVAQQTTTGSVSGSGAHGQAATLTATLSSAGAGVAGQSISFAVDGTPVGTATTDDQGIATLGGVSIVGTTTGHHVGAVTASFAGDTTHQASSGTGDLVVAPAGQDIVFDSTHPGAVVGGSDYAPAATGGASGNPVVLGIGSTTTNGACELTDGTVSFVHAGTCVITADQAGNDDFAAASTTRQELSVGAATQTVAFTSTAPTAATVGDTYAAAAGGGASGKPVVFSTDPSTTGGACSVTAQGAVTLAHAGSCVIAADQAGDADHVASPTARQTVAVSAATTSTTVTVGPESLSATVTATKDSAGTPTGTVEFSVNGVVVGSAPLDGSGIATLTFAVPAGDARNVAAAYSGTGDFTGGSASTSRTDPTITATVSSARPRTARGWYSGPVTVRFTCTAGSAPLTAPCPDPVVLGGSAAGQSLTRTVTTTDGGAATAAVSGVDIDRTRPSVSVRGVRNGGTYRGAGPRTACAASDALSGIVRCDVRTRTRRGLTLVTATATNGAGLSSTTTRTYRVLGMWLQGAPYGHGRFGVGAGRTYTLLVASRVRPRYEWAAPAVGHGPATRPHGGNVAFRPNRAGQWEIRVTMSRVMARSHQQWNLGARVGRAQRVIRVAFTG